MNWPEDFINKVHCKDAFEFMKSIPSGVIDMCMTSPPYWGLRDYGVEQIFGGDKDCEHEFGIIHRRANDKSGGHGHAGYIGAEKAQDAARFGPPTKTCSKCHAWKGQLGLEPTPELYIEHMTEIFNEVKRVLKKEGTLWLNIGDTYGGSGKGSGDDKPDPKFKGGGRERTLKPDKTMPSKCLCMIPERLAWSLIQNGWILRNKIVWYKPNAMPSSVWDRFSNRWEYIFLFSKNNKAILWCHDKTKEWTDKKPLGTKGIEGIDWEWRIVSEEDPKDPDELIEKRKKVSLWDGFTYYFDLDAVRESHLHPEIQGLPGHIDRQKIGIDLYRSCPSGPRNLNPDGKNPGDVFEINTQPFPEAHFAVFPEKLCIKPIKAGCPEDGVVLDPFCGAGTTLYVAKQLRRNYIGIDIKQEYCKMSEKRLAQGVLP